jgi:hypothetical protein
MVTLPVTVYTLLEYVHPVPFDVVLATLIVCAKAVCAAKNINIHIILTIANRAGIDVVIVGTKRIPSLQLLFSTRLSALFLPIFL